ncbi:hypothetical protein BV20DRAFT_951577 [Pilatotrama ljubarskyi]|nr:hypothetical protein BV20DRAFT_951577 [Pilatotrama ljubarskyi]
MEPQITAASRALQFPEILSSICLQLAPGRLKNKAHRRQRVERMLKQKTLARLARVCRAFSEPALDMLWQLLDNISHLLSVLPPFIDGGRPGGGKRVYVLSRDISDPEWVRFREYALRVRELHTNHEQMRLISPSVWTFLRRRCPVGQGLLPRLVCLKSFVASEEDPGHILLVSSTLRHLSVFARIPETPEASWTIDAAEELALKTVTPKLESLRLNRLPCLGPWELCSRFPHLQYLKITEPVVLENEVLRLLAAFPLLQKLSLNVMVRLSDKLEVQPSGLGRLRELRLTGDPAALDGFLQVMHPAHLHALKLKFDDWSLCTDDEAIKHVHSALSSVTPLTRRLSIWLAGDGPRVADLLKPALSFNWLTHLSITLERYIPELVINDTELQTFSQAWPNLVEFELSLEDIDVSEDVLNVPDTLSARTLTLFAELHPFLSRLVLPYIQLFNGSIPDMETVTLLDHGLKHLRICVVEDADHPQFRDFAWFIDAIFPNLDLSQADFHSYSDAPDEEFLNWYDVEQLLVTLQAGRGGVLPRRRPDRRFKLRRTAAM